MWRRTCTGAKAEEGWACVHPLKQLPAVPVSQLSLSNVGRNRIKP